MLEYTALLFGYQNLLLLAMAFYALSALVGLRTGVHKRSAPVARATGAL